MNDVLFNKESGSIKVLVVDDSPMMCKAIEKILVQDDQIEVTAKALSGREALRALSTKQFDVCTLDVHMPGMNGLSVLKNIMVKHPIPTLMVSAFTGDGSKITFEALRFGAVDFFKKPARNGDKEIQEQGESLIKSLKRASRVQVQAARYLRVKPVSRKGGFGKKTKYNPDDLKKICIIYGSTGGYSSVLAIVPFLMELPKGSVIVSLAVSKENLAAFVDYLQPYSVPHLSMITDDTELRPGHVYFIPADYAAHFDKAGKGWEMSVKERPIESSKEGAIDLTLLSASESFCNGLLSIFVSGDSPFGVTGAEEVVRNNGTLIVQRPAGCLAPYGPEMMMERFSAKSAEPYEISKLINNWMI